MFNRVRHVTHQLSARFHSFSSRSLPNQNILQAANQANSYWEQTHVSLWNLSLLAFYRVLFHILLVSCNVSKRAMGTELCWNCLDFSNMYDISVII